LIPVATAGVEWEPPKFEYLNPLDDARADLMMVRMGATSLRRVVARQGENLDDILEETKATNDAVDALGIVLGSDPRKVTQQGLYQPETAAQPAKA
jgi:capsid protein